MYEVWCNCPDQDHIRHWIKIGECKTVGGFKKIADDFINKWKGTSNYLRLQEDGSFEMRVPPELDSPSSLETALMNS